MFKNSKIGIKIGAGFGVLILLTAILGYAGWSGVNQVRSYMGQYAL